VMERLLGISFPSKNSYTNHIFREAKTIIKTSMLVWQASNAIEYTTKLHNIIFEVLVDKNSRQHIHSNTPE